MIVYVRAGEIQDGLCEWAKRLIVSRAKEMDRNERAALEAAMLEVAHLLWSVSSVVNNPQCKVLA